MNLRLGKRDEDKYVTPGDGDVNDFRLECNFDNTLCVSSEGHEHGSDNRRVREL